MSTPVPFTTPFAQPATERFGDAGLVTGISGLVTGISDPRRLKAVADAELRGHLGDNNLGAIVATLKVACRAPIAIVNIVTPNLHFHAAEVGVGAACTEVDDELSFCAEVVQTGRELVVADARAHGVYSRNPVVQKGLIGSYAGVPLVDDVFVLGAVSIFDHVARSFTDDELDVLRHQAKLASSVLSMRRSARTDTLTGLPNRSLCLDSLARTLSRLSRNERGVAVMFVDVDDFKSVNDTLGHAVGDQLLIELGHRMSAVLRPTDTLARFGGDEFVVVCEDIADPAEAGEVADRLLSAIGTSMPIYDKSVPVSISIGVAVATDPESRVEDVIRAADGAMYQAKHSDSAPRWRLAGAPEKGATIIPEPQRAVVVVTSDESASRVS